MSSRKNRVWELNELHGSYMAGKIDRRTLFARAGTLGLAASALAMYTRGINANAQQATPVTAVLPGGFKSLTREEYRARLAVDYPFTAPDVERAQGGIVILGDLSGSNLTTLNPIFAQNFPTQDILFTVFDQMVGIYPAGGSDFVPGLADWYEVAEDGATYTFHLNQSATFHDGAPVTAHDVVFSCDSVANPESGGQYQQTFVDSVASYSAIDDYTVQVVSNGPMPQIVFIPNFFCPVLPTHIWSQVPIAQWQSDPGSTGDDPARVVGSGSFRFESINASEGTATFLRYDGHYSEPPAIEKYIFQTWPDDTAIVEALRADQLDAYLSNVPPGEVESFQTDENLGLAVYDTYDFTFYGYNLDATKTTLFQEQAVRQALIFAIDRQSIVDNVYLGFAAVAIGTQPVLSEAYAPDRLTTIYNYDPARAGQMLDGAGWVIGGDGIREKDGVKLSFDFMFDAGSATSVSVAAAVQDYWKAIGVDGQPSAVDFDTVIVPAATETFDFRIMMLGIQGGSPSGDQSIIFGSDMRGAGLNLMGYSNPAYDELAAQSNVEVDPEKRIELLIQATDIVNEDVPLAALWFPKNRIGYGKRLQNFSPTANGLLWSMPFVTVAQ